MSCFLGLNPNMIVFCMYSSSDLFDDFQFIYFSCIISFRVVLLLFSQIRAFLLWYICLHPSNEGSCLITMELRFGQYNNCIWRGEIILEIIVAYYWFVIKSRIFQLQPLFWYNEDHNFLLLTYIFSRLLFWLPMWNLSALIER